LPFEENRQRGCRGQGDAPAGRGETGYMQFCMDFAEIKIAGFAGAAAFNIKRIIYVIVIIIACLKNCILRLFEKRLFVHYAEHMLGIGCFHCETLIAERSESVKYNINHVI